MELTPATLALIAPCLLLGGAVLQLVLARFLSPRARGVLAVLCSLPALAAVVTLLPAVRSAAAVDLALGPWDGPLALVLHIDALSVLFAIMGTGIGSAVLVYSVGYMAEERATARFYSMMLCFIGGLVCLVFSANLFVLYLCWEVVGLCSFGLVGFWYQLPEAVSGARKVLLMTHLAGYGLLAAILVVYGRTGSAIWTDPAVASAFTSGVFLLMLLALVAKSVQFPLHTWIPEAMAAPTPVSALLHAACYVKAGVYLAARMHSFGPWQPTWGISMVTVGTVTMAVGVLYAMIQSDLKRMLAFSTVSQIGYMITGLGIGTPLGITAGLLHCLNHGFFKGGLFLASGAVQHAAGTRDMDQLGGLAQRMPRTTAAWLVNAGSMMGVPLASGFASKWLLYTAALQAGMILPALVAWVCSVGTVFYCAKATNAVFLGAPTAKTEQAHEAPASMQWGLGLLAAGSLVLGVAPQLPVNYLLNPVLATLGLGAGVEVSWFGITGSAGSWWTTGGLVLAIVSVAVGAVIYVLAGPSRTAAIEGQGVLAGGGVFTGGEPLAGEGRLSASDFSEFLKQHWGSFYRWADVDRYYLAVWRWLQALAQGTARIAASGEKHPALWSLGLAAVLLFGLRWFAPGVTEVSIAAEPPIPLALVLACALACCCLCLGALASAPWARLAPLMALTGAAAVTGLAAPQPLWRLVLLEASTLLAVWLVWRATVSAVAKRTYLAIALFSAVTLVCGEILLDGGNADWARALFIAGFFVKLAVVPMAFWLPRIAEDLPALVVGLIIAVLDMAVLGELSLLVQAAPWLAQPSGLWLALAMLSALLGSVLMLVQRNLRRLLALSSIEDLGFLLLGLSSGSQIGTSGVLVGAAVHALAKSLLFVSLSAPEADGALERDEPGLAARYPFCGAGFVFGMLAMLGVPPTLGFAGRWRLYETAAQAGPWVLLIFVISSGLALVAYALALTRLWWGPSQPERRAQGEAAPLRAVVLVLILVILAAGIWPEGLQALTRSIR